MASAAGPGLAAPIRAAPRISARLISFISGSDPASDCLYMVRLFQTKRGRAGDQFKRGDGRPWISHSASWPNGIFWQSWKKLVFTRWDEALILTVPSLIIGVLFLATPALAEKTWRPKPIFTDAICSKELANARPAFNKKIEDLKIEVPKSNRDDPEIVAIYEKFLERTDRETEQRAIAQESAAGKWKGKTRYEILRWRKKNDIADTKYRIGSCQVAKKKIPLNRALAVATAASEATEADKELAKTIRSYIAMKKERETCRTLRPWKKARSCLKRTAKFDWLDRYHLTDSADDQTRRGRGS